MTSDNQNKNPIPQIATDYLDRVIKKMRYRRKVRDEVRRELTAHFTDALADCENDTERNEQAQILIEEFGDPKLLAKLIRRGKKRCRPLWQKVMIRLCQSVVVLYFIACFYNLWLIQSWRSIDYAEKLIQLNRGDADDSENAWPYYEKAIELYVEKSDVLQEFIDQLEEPNNCYWEFEPAIQRHFDQWFEANNETRQYVISGCNKTCVWHTSLNIFEINYLRGIRDLARLMRWEAEKHIADNQIEKAIENYLVTIKMGCQFWNSHFIVESLNGLSIEPIGQKGIMQILKSVSLDNIMLGHIQAELEGLYIRARSINAQSFKWHVDALLSQQNSFIVTSEDEPFYYLWPTNFLSETWENRESSEASWKEHYAQMDYRKPYEQSLNNPDYYTITDIWDDLGSIYSQEERDRCHLFIIYEHQASFDALITLLAIHRWKLQHNDYPENLKVLLDSDYLKRLPDDPYGPGPLKYKRHNNDFILYSLGGDFEDDGGVPNPSNQWGGLDFYGWKKEINYDKDKIFWPLQ